MEMKICYNKGYRALKRILLFTLMVPFAVQSSAQKFRMDQVSLTYFAPLAVDPGAKVGVGFSLSEWNKIKNGKTGSSKTIKHQLSIQPQLAYVSKWRFYSSYLANIETAWKFGKVGGRFFSGFGVGLGYIHRQEVSTLMTHFDGSTEVLETQNRNFFFPSVNYQLGMRLYRKLDLFSKVHYGYQFSSKYTSQSALILEAGLRLNLVNKTATDE